MQDPRPDAGIELDRSAAAQFMPMHLLLDEAGRAVSFGPTLARVLGAEAVPGARFEELFKVRSPGGVSTAEEVLARSASRFRLVPRRGARIGLRGLGQRLASGRILMNLSFGSDLITAVRELALTDADFAATDLALELLFMAEANEAVKRELKGWSLRLDGARMAAEEEAMTDPLTGLRNRRAVDLVLERLCAARAGFGLLHMDLDYFKAVNDTRGHAAGDFVLETVGHILRKQIRAEDCAARIGGDEFVVILTGRTEPKMLQSIAERIIARISQPMEFEGEVCKVSASIGIVRSLDLAVPEPVQLLAAADRALYAAKHAGRGRAVLEAAGSD